MTPEALRKFALSLPEAHEEPHFERRSFRVQKKIFATMTRDGREAMVRVQAPDGVEALMTAHPEVFFSHGTWTERNGAIGVRLARVDAELMRGLVTESWRRIAPKKTVAEFDAAGTPRRTRSPRPRRS
jgi:hypothetical protein